MQKIKICIVDVAGQAIQNMNLMFRLPENAGLTNVAWFSSAQRIDTKIVMFAFQPPPPFAEMEQIEIADAKVSDFKPIYFTKKYANLYQSNTQPLHYPKRILFRPKD